MFSLYYRRYSELVEEPSDLTHREFAFTFFDRPGMSRHIVFSSAKEMREFLARNVPQHAYYSSAYYEYPDAERMEEKVWLGADLVFDIDVDHIATPCKAQHDTWHCPNCGASGWGFIESCPKCGNENLKRKTWVCETCISVARDEVIKLLDMLLEDFGFSDSEMFVVFSGHRGFHVHVEGDAVRDLDQDARREIADYVRGVGLEPEAFTVPGRRKNSLKMAAKPDDPGWYGRIARAVLDWVLSLDRASAARVVRGRRVRSLLELSERAREDPMNTDWIEDLELTREEWSRLISLIAREEGVEIDERVTIDIKRLIRLPGTLHGKTGLRVISMSPHEVENIDVLEKARVLSDEEVPITIKSAPKRVLDIDLSNVSGKAKVPLYLSLYLVANGADVELSREPYVAFVKGLVS